MFGSAPPEADGDAPDELVELIVVAEGELQVPGDDGLPLGFTGSVAGEFKDLAGQVLHDGGHEDS